MTATAGRPATSLLARVYSRLSDRYQTVGQVAKDDATDAVARALRVLVDDGLAERDGARWRRRQATEPARQAPEPTPPAELPPAPAPPEPAAVVLPDLADTVQAAASSRPWWTRSELATSVEIRSGNGYRRAAIEVEIARQLDDGRLCTDKLGTLVGTQPAEPPEASAADTDTDTKFEPAIRTWRTTAPDRVLAALREHPEGLTVRELAAATGLSSSRAGQLVRELGCLSVAERPGQTARRRWHPPASGTSTPAEPPAPSTTAEPGSANTTIAPSPAPAEDLQSGDPTDRAQHGASSDTPHPPPPVGPATSGEDAAPCKPEADGSGVLAEPAEPTPASPEAAEGAAPASAGVLPEPEVVRIERDPTPVDVGLTLAARVGELEAELAEAKEDADQFAAEARVARAALRDALGQVQRDLAEARAALAVLDLVLTPAERDLPAAARAGLVVGQLQILRGGLDGGAP